MDKANPRVSATPPGIRFTHRLSPCTRVTIGCKTGFYARGYTYIFLFLRRAPRYDPAAQQQSSPRAAAVQPPSSSSLQLYARFAAAVVADLFDRSAPFVTSPYPIFLLCCCAAAACACPYQVRRSRQFGQYRNLLDRNLNPTHPYVYVYRGGSLCTYQGYCFVSEILPTHHR